MIKYWNIEILEKFQIILKNLEKSWKILKNPWKSSWKSKILLHSAAAAGFRMFGEPVGHAGANGAAPGGRKRRRGDDPAAAIEKGQRQIAGWTQADAAALGRSADIRRHRPCHSPW